MGRPGSAWPTKMGSRGPHRAPRGGEMLLGSPQVFPGLRAVCQDGLDGGAGLQLRAAPAGGDSPLLRALADGAHLLAEHRLDALRAAAQTADVLRQDGSLVQLRPQLRGPLPQRLVVMDGREVGVSRRAVQPAETDHVPHFHTSSGFWAAHRLSESSITESRGQVHRGFEVQAGPGGKTSLPFPAECGMLGRS